MQSHLAFIVFSICYFIINAQTTDHSTVPTVVAKVIVLETTMIPTTEDVKVEQTTVPSTTNPVTMVLNKVLTPVYVEPPPHPLGYCIRSRLRCTRIRRCCNGPCDVNNMKCP